MTWSKICTIALTVSLASYICYIVLSTSLEFVDYSFRLRLDVSSNEAVNAAFMERALFRMLSSTITSLLLMLGVLGACLAVVSFAASRGLLIVGVSGAIWVLCACLVLAIRLVGGLPVGLSPALLHAVNRVWGFWDIEGPLLIILVSGALIAVEDFRHNSLVRVAAVLAIPACIATLPWIFGLNMVALAICCFAIVGILRFCKARSFQLDVFVLFAVFAAINMYQPALEEFARFSGKLSPNTYVPSPALYLHFARILLPLMAASIIYPATFPKLRMPLIAIFGISLLSWVFSIGPRLRDGSTYFKSAFYNHPLVLPGPALRVQYVQFLEQQQLVIKYGMPMLLFVNSMLILWCYLQVWKMRRPVPNSELG